MIKINIDLSNLKDVGSYKKIEKEIKIADFKYQNQEIKTPYPFELDLKIYKTDDFFIFTGTFTGILILVCSRCLEKFEQEIEISIDEEIEFEEIDDPNHYDITEILIENIILSLPIKYLCSEDCQGLCSVCGINLNQKDCDCETETLDPRLAKLKDFFQEEDQ